MNDQKSETINEPKTEPPKVLASKTRDELKVLAMDLFKEKVFMDWHIPEDSFNSMVSSIFMPIALGALNDAIADQIGVAYEYLDKAGPRAINGYPSFFSVQFLNKDDAFRLFKLHMALRKFPEMADTMDQILDKADVELIKIKKEIEDAKSTT